MAEDSGDVLDSWEDQVDSGILDERLKKISVSNKASEGSARAQPIMMQEDTGRTEYRPQVRILKREPNTNSNNEGNSPRVVLPKPLKTLEQREAAYAEARLRIFGAAEPEPEPEPDSSDSNSVGVVNCLQAACEKPSKVNKTEVKSANIVIRQPRGPDGSKGFNADR